MARKESSQDLFDLLNSMVGDSVLRKAAEHITDQVSDDSQPVQPGEKGQEIEEEIKDEYGNTGVTEDQSASDAPEVNPASTVPADPSAPKTPSTTQPIPDESPGHVTNEALADTRKQAHVEWQESLLKMGEALEGLAETLGSIKSAEESDSEDEEKDEEEESEEEEKKPEEISEDIVKDKTAKDAPEKPEESEEKEIDEVEAGKEAAQMVADLLAKGAEEAEVQEGINFIETIVKSAESDADMLCDFLDGYVMSRPEKVRKEAGLPPMGPGLEEALMGAGGAAGLGGAGGLGGPPGLAEPMAAPGGAPMELTFDELIAILQALMAGKAPETPEEQLVADLLAQAGLNVTPEPESQEEAPAALEEEKPASIGQVKQLIDLLTATKDIAVQDEKGGK